MSFTDPFMPETKIIDFAECWNALLSKSTCFYSRTPICQRSFSGQPLTWGGLAKNSLVLVSVWILTGQNCKKSSIKNYPSWFWNSYIFRKMGLIFLHQVFKAQFSTWKGLFKKIQTACSFRHHSVLLFCSILIEQKLLEVLLTFTKLDNQILFSHRYLAELFPIRSQPDTFCLRRTITIKRVNDFLLLRSWYSENAKKCW